MSTLETELDRVRETEKVPALAAAAVVDGQLVDIAAVGCRSLNDETLVTTDDKWHIGSCTKPMTATLAGILIERGKMDWRTTIGDVLDKYSMRDEWRGVTLEQLLSNYGGVNNCAITQILGNSINGSMSPFEQRSQIVKELLMLTPHSVPGKRFLYSNNGYAIAGHMLEVIAHNDWEQLITTLLFQPLDMKSAGFGAPGSKARLDQPRGHRHEKSAAGRKPAWTLQPVQPGPGADNPPAIGPGATVHCSIHDLAKFASLHAGTASGARKVSTNVIHDETRQRLHKPFGRKGYALGWFVVPRPWGKGSVLNHNGSNLLWYTAMWVAPQTGAVFVAATNAGGNNAFRACDAAIWRLICRRE